MSGDGRLLKATDAPLDAARSHCVTAVASDSGDSPQEVSAALQSSVFELCVQLFFL